MSSDNNSPTTPARRHYFVDEAGDPVLFDSRGRALPGTEGCSRHFILGVLDVADPVALASDLVQLRLQLLQDPYFKDVPSMQPERRKTALAFHAKDDLPEVRREVFRLLLTHDVQFFAVVRNKASVLEYVRQRNQHGDAYRYQPNELYDKLVARLFKDRLHLSPESDVCFAERGKSDRTAALAKALTVAQHRFATQWQRQHETTVTARQSSPPKDVALQAVDYFLWALQRYFERHESRYIELLWPKVGLVHAVDETATAPYGVYYTKKKPLPKPVGNDSGQ